MVRKSRKNAVEEAVEPEVIPEFDVKINKVGDLLVWVSVQNLDNGQIAQLSCGPNSDFDAIANKLKNGLIHRQG